MSTHTKIIIHKKTHYAERDKKGHFTDITNIAKAIKKDSARKTRHKVKRGHGHEGDLKY